jgi:hypothetical protein
MKKFVSMALVAAAAAAASSPLLADEYIAATTCKLNEGKKVEDV